MPSLYSMSETVTNFLGMVGLGQKTKAGSLSMTLASDSDALPMTDNGGSLTVDGAVAVSGTVAVDGSGHTQPVSGTVAVSNLPATQPISAAALPLPAGAAQEHTAAATPAAVRLSDGAAFYKGTTPADTQPVSAAAASQADGHSATLGATTDAAVTTDATGSVSARLRGLVNLIAARLPAALATNGGLKVEENAAAYNADTTLQNAATGTGNGTVMDVSGMAAVSLQVSGTFVGTITFEANSDGATWTALQMTNLRNAVFGTTAAAPDLYLRAVGGFKQVRARISAYTSGSITVTGHAVAAGAVPTHGLGVAVGSGNGLSDGMNGLGQTASDRAGNSAALGVVPMLFNGITAGWDRPRSNTDLSLLASAARTSTTASADQTNYNGRALLLFVNVSSIGTGSITPTLQVKDSISGDYFTIWTAGAALTANGDYVYYFSDGASGGTFTEKLAFGLPARTWRVNVTANNANSATYSVSGVTRV